VPGLNGIKASKRDSRIPLNEVFDVLRSGLATLVPVVERIGIPWREKNGDRSSF